MTNNKKIVIATGIYPPTVGGPASYTKLLENELPKNNFDLKVISFDRYLWLPTGIRHLVFCFILFFKTIGTKGIYAQDPVSVGLPTMIVSKILFKPYLLKVVGDYAWEQGVQRFGVTDDLDLFVKKNEEYKAPVRFLKSVQNAVARNAELVVVPSKYLAGIISAWGILDQKIKVIYNAFERPIDSNQSINLSGKPIIVSAGRLVPWKGFRELIDCMPNLIKEFPELRLFIAGSGPDKDFLEKQIQEKNLKEHVILLGSIDKNLLFNYLKKSDVFVLYSRYEGLSHLLLEALSAKTIVIASSAGGNKEVIVDGENGFLVPLDDKEALERRISYVLKDSLIKNILGANIDKQLKTFDKERMISEISQTLNRIFV